MFLKNNNCIWDKKNSKLIQKNNSKHDKFETIIQINLLIS